MDRLASQLDSLVEGYALQAVESPSLPSVWALAFLASLSVTIAHIVYQAFAPSLIRESTKREFYESEVRRFVESPSDGQLEQSLRILKNTLTPHKVRFDGEMNQDEDDLYVKREEVAIDAKQREEITIIQCGAEQMYFEVARRNIPAAIASSVFYLLGLALILWIILTQTLKVVLAAWGG